jgi:hypothetical protein
MIHYHGKKAGSHSAWAAEEKAVYDSEIGTYFPQTEKEEEKEKPQKSDRMMMFSVIF